MTIEQIRRLHQARPYIPFDINLADGRSFPVDHPELLLITPPGRTIVVGLADGTVEVVDLLLVTSLHQRNQSPPKRPRRSAT